MSEEEPVDIETRLEVIEARLADLERGPAPRLSEAAGTRAHILNDELFQAAIGSAEKDPSVDERVSAALWAAQVIARDVDVLRAALDDALNSPGSRPNPN